MVWHSIAPKKNRFRFLHDGRIPATRQGQSHLTPGSGPHNSGPRAKTRLDSGIAPRCKFGRMAKVSYGPIIADARGSTGAVTFYRNRGGAVSRLRFNPPDHNTPAQQTVRNAYSAALTRWTNTLTDAQRQAWTQFGRDFPTDVPIAGTIALTGNAAFKRQNLLIARLGLPWVDDPPANRFVTEPTALSILKLEAGPGPFSIQADPLPGSQELGLLYASPLFSPGILNFTDTFRLIDTWDSTATMPRDITATWLTNYLTMTQGKKIALRFGLLNKTTGTASLRLSTSTIIQPQGGPMFQVTVTLQDADIKALPSTAFQLLPTPPTGYRYKVLHIFLDADCSHGHYTNIVDQAYMYARPVTDNETTNLLCDDAANTEARVTELLTNDYASAVLSPYTDTKDHVYGNVPNVTTSAVGPIGTAQALRLNMSNGAGDLTGGGAGNTLRATVTYILVV